MEETREVKPIEAKKDDYLIVPLEKPVEFEKTTIKQLDLTKLRDMTLDELSEIYDVYSALGEKEGVMQEFSIKFVKLLAQHVTGYPLEAIGKVSAKDAVRLKARVYRFFYL